MNENPSGEAAGATAIDPELLKTIITGHFKPMLDEAVAGLQTQLKAVTDENAELRKLVEARPTAEAKDGDATGAAASPELLAKIEELSGKFAALESEKSSKASADARTKLLLELRPGLKDRPRLVQRIVASAAGDDKDSILATIGEIAEEFAESGVDAGPLKEDFAAAGGKADKTSGSDSDDERVKRIRDRADAAQNRNHSEN